VPALAPSAVAKGKHAVKRTRSYRPQVEVLEGRALPSAQVITAPAGPIILVITNQPRHTLSLSGTVSGLWSQSPGVPDVGAEQVLAGGGVVAPLGAVQANGGLLLPGFILAGEAQGRVLLKNAHGSVTVQLAGPPQPGFSAAPTGLAYTILRGTGRYAGARGGGTATLQETPAQMPFCPPNAICATFIIAPRFTLTFTPGPA
jgi:hypothetical protein